MILRSWTTWFALAISAVFSVETALSNPVASSTEHTPSATWTMVNVNRSMLQGDAHLIEFPDGKKLLIDTGYRGETAALINLLAEKKIHRLDWVLITHPHRDHYEGLLDLLGREIEIGTIYTNQPDPERCHCEHPWGCNMAHYESTIDKAKKAGAKIRQVTPGMTIHSSGGVSMKVLYALREKTSPIGVLCINDTSVITMLEVGSTKALFTGDMDRPLSEYMVDHSPSLHANLLKVSHHGTEGTASNRFFDAISPQVAMVPSPKSLWFSDRSKRVFDYFHSKSSPVYVNGINGNVAVKLWADHFEVCPTFDDTGARPPCHEYSSIKPPAIPLSHSQKP